MPDIKSSDVGTYIDELRHALWTASLNFDVWWVYKNKESREKYVETMNDYLWFFTTGLNAHFVALLIPLYRLYENKADTYNIPKLLDFLNSSSALPADVLGELNRKKAEALPIWEKVKILRNRAFGHRSRAHTTEELFKEAQMSADDLINLIRLTKRLLNDISQSWNRNIDAFSSDAVKDTERLLEDLTNLCLRGGEP